MINRSEKRITNSVKLKARSSLFAFIFSLFASFSYAATSPVASEDAFLLDTLWTRYRTTLPKDDLKIGIALGGGGARGLAHIGVLKALEEEDVPVSAIAGTSVGALIGGLYAAGVSTAQLEEMTREIGWTSLTNMTRYSLFRLFLTEVKLSTKNMEVYLRQHIGDTRFDELKIPFVCLATDLQTGEGVVFREGSVAMAARASATIPGMFEPVLFRHRYLVDGGLVSNIPIDLLPVMGAQLMIAVDVTADFAHAQPKSILAVLNQAIYIQSERLAQRELAGAHVIIRPRMGDVGPMDLARSDECIDAGILAGRGAVPTIKRLILDKRLSQILQVGRKKS